MACAFCELLLSGEARWVAREPDAVAFAPLPADEFAPGHTLVVPRRHAVGIHDADERDVVAVAALVRRVSRAMLSALGATGVVVLNASGPNSGQTVDHLHVHVVPRWDDDEATLPWLRQRSTRSLPAPAQQLLAAELRSASRPGPVGPFLEHDAP
ncbi:HIT family protein [Jatrophihabitans sp.]|uniref:HIT family protein n=1 Tax=Jatrophihabitans sp. TaxID=1932789 RepID=UPI002EF1F723